ncbi:Ff.00g040210.m01.CDS01 [Fusarium sp. VM40]|nr:Ff.00g040210.m01.CDS01 [Fusarium sp. VM40]
MATIRSLLVLVAAAGIASAGKCKPESRSTTMVSASGLTTSAIDIVSSTVSASVTLIESTTIQADTTVETTLTESASSPTSLDTTEASTSESKPTTLVTSFTTRNADTTTAPVATTTSAAPGPVVTCPSEMNQCLGTMKIQCDVILASLSDPTTVSDLNECAQQCNSDTSCTAFTYSEDGGQCFKARFSSSFTQADVNGFVSGIKGTCGQNTEPSSTVFTSTAETTTAEAPASTTSAAPVNSCPSETGQCINGARIQCDVALGDLSVAGVSSDIAECSQFCANTDDCRGFSRRRDTGACFLVFADPDDVTQDTREGWDSGIMYTCFN